MSRARGHSHPRATSGNYHRLPSRHTTSRADLALDDAHRRSEPVQRQRSPLSASSPRPRRRAISAPAPRTSRSPARPARPTPAATFAPRLDRNCIGRARTRGADENSGEVDGDDSLLACAAIATPQRRGPSTPPYRPNASTSAPASISSRTRSSASVPAPASTALAAHHSGDVEKKSSSPAVPARQPRRSQPHKQDRRQPPRRSARAIVVAPDAVASGEAAPPQQRPGG